VYRAPEYEVLICGNIRLFCRIIGILVRNIGLFLRHISVLEFISEKRLCIGLKNMKCSFEKIYGSLSEL